MRLSDFKDEEALDLIADLIDPIATIMADEEVQTAYRAKLPILLIAKKAIKNQKHAIIEALAILHKIPVDEYTFDGASLIKDVTDFLNDPVLINLFTLQGQENYGKSSGSAMENTEAIEKM